VQVDGQDVLVQELVVPVAQGFSDFLKLVLKSGEHGTGYLIAMIELVIIMRQSYYLIGNVASS